MVESIGERLVEPEKIPVAMSMVGTTWDPEGNQAFIDSLKADLNPSFPLTELDAHINDPDFIDPVTEVFLSMMKGVKGAKHV